MAETEKRTSSSANSKEKNSLLDLDIGNDFLNSWKSISIGDDAMDFDFGPISKNKKKAFNFDQEDMDFNLDSDFSKMPSFNIDMSDLDISSPSKKNGKAKEKPKESSGASNKGKTDGFNFHFDFKELDIFSLQSSPRKEDQSKKDLEIEGSSETNAHQGSVVHLTEDVGVLDAGAPKKHSVTEMTSTADSSAASGLTPDSIRKNLSSERTANNTDTSISFTTVTHASDLLRTRTSPKRSTSTNTQPTELQIEKGTSPQLVAPEATADVYDHSSGHKLNSKGGSDLLEKDCPMGENINSSYTDKDFEHVANLDSNEAKTMPERLTRYHKNASQEAVQESGKFEKEKHLLVSNIEGNGTHPGCTYIASPKKDDHSTLVNVEIEETISKPLKPPSSSGSDQNLMQGEGECSTVRSKFFMPSIETTAQKQKKSLLQAKVSDVGSKRIVSSQPNHADEGMAYGKDDENGKKAGITLPGSRPQSKTSTLQTGSQDSFKGLSANISHVKPLSIIQQGKSMLHNTGNPRVIESSVSSATAKNIPVGGNKNCPIKASSQSLESSSPKFGGSQTLDSSSQNLSKNLGASLSVSQSFLLKDDRTSRHFDQNTGLKSMLQAKVSSSITTTTQKTNVTPLKRKRPEITGGVIMTSPFKHPPESPTNGNRDICGISERIVAKKDNYREDQTIGSQRAECKSSPASALDIHKPVNRKELGDLQTLEDDDNVDKAETYTKALEDICNMLRKMHEEAKELLVRSIVNNNKLLMLNHPIHDEKISFFLPLLNVSVFCL
ncbi:unnamed protein product [Cuscuta epithymum]|uniref:Uncharacterized protein n=1 Tax=Cuscuta epithymum TaxID=186058 RepID=A0AAV0E765_9ASTE|nr:unnamed protein product [Cuscuta epithymum]